VIPRLHHRTRLGCKLVQFGRLDAIGDLRANLLRHKVGVHMLKAGRQTLDATKHLVEGNRLPRAIPLCDVNVIRHPCYHDESPYL
jgi:hypothetical protein